MGGISRTPGKELEASYGGYHTAGAKGGGAAPERNPKAMAAGFLLRKKFLIKRPRDETADVSVHCAVETACVRVSFAGIVLTARRVRQIIIMHKQAKPSGSPHRIICPSVARRKMSQLSIKSMTRNNRPNQPKEASPRPERVMPKA